VIQSFADKETEKIWNRQRSRKLRWGTQGPENVTIEDYH
jgi:hypothetical protein